MANRIVGLKNIHIAKLNANGQYEAPIKLVGAKSVKTTNESSEVAFYSDDVMERLESIVNKAKELASEVFVTDYNKKVA